MTNSLYTHDNLYIMQGMNSESVDLIYLDPPFNSKRNYAAPIDSKAAGTAFKDMWTWQDVDEFRLNELVEINGLIDYIQSIGNIHGKPMMAYATYMAQRIIQMHRILKLNGSIYLHCDTHASHYIKPLVDAILGNNNFLNEIIWHYQTGGAGKRWFSRKHDTILLYGKGKHYIFNHEIVRVARTEKAMRRAQNPTGARISADNNSKVAMDVWVDLQALNPMAKERTGYETQKPLTLLHRIIKASSNAGDIVFDPFCGCATTCVAAQQLGRQWIGIDIEASAPALLIERLSDDAGMFSDFVHLTKPPVRTDVVAVEPSLPVKKTLYNAQGRKCNGCYNEYFEKDLEIDHIIPKSKGGGDYIENYQLLCSKCNKTKGDRPMEFLRMRNEQIKTIMKSKITFGE